MSLENEGRKGRIGPSKSARHAPTDGGRRPQSKATSVDRNGGDQVSVEVNNAPSYQLLTNQPAPSAEDLRDDKLALAEFRRVLCSIVQNPSHESADQTVSIFGAIANIFNIARMLRRFSSASLFGRQLSFEELVGKYVSLVPALESPINLPYSEMALMGMYALRSGRVAIAQAICEEVRFLTSSSVALVFVMRGIARFVVFGACAIFLSLYMLFLAILRKGPAVSFKVSSLQATLNFDPVQALRDFGTAVIGTSLGHVLLATLFGCLGSVVSLLLRLGEFETTKGRSREFLFLSGATLPIVGGIFAAVIAALLSSKILNTSFQVENIWIFVVVGFLSGFSERFTRNLLSMAEGRFPVGARQSGASHR